MSQTPSSSSTEKFVAYYRVSTQQQGASGLGLEAQQESVARYVTRHGGVIIAEFTETESGKKAHNRPALGQALEMARKQNAVLLIAKLDRLARNVHFVSGLMESSVRFVAADMPTTDRLMLHVQAAFAEEEARRISVRTKEALAAAKRRGVVLGAAGKVLAARHKREAVERAETYRELVVAAQASGVRSTRQLRDHLNAAGVAGPGGGRWHLPTTFRTLKRLGLSLAQRVAE